MKKITALIICVYCFYGSFAQSVNSKNDNGLNKLFNKAYLTKLFDNTEISNFFIRKSDFYYYNSNEFQKAVSLYNKHNYAKSAVYFEKVNNRYYENDIVLEYLYYAYKFSGQNKNAEILSESFSNEFKNKLNIENFILKSVFVGSSYLTNNENVRIKNIDIDGDDDIFGENIITNNLKNYNFGLGFAVLKRFNVNFSLSQIVLSKTQSITERGNILKYNFFDTQTQFYGRINYHAQNNFDFSVAGNYIKGDNSLKSILYSYSYSDLIENNSQQIYDTIYNADAKLDIVDTIFNYNETVSAKSVDNVTKYNDFAFSIKISKRFTYFSGSFSTVYSSINDNTSLNGGVGLTIFPFGNLKLYSASELIAKFALGADEIQFRPKKSLILKQKLGFKITNFLWTELFYMTGTMYNFADNEAFTIYNSYESYKKQIGIGLIFPLFKNKFTISLKYFLIQKQNSYLAYVFDKNEDKTYQGVLYRTYTYENDSVYNSEPENFVVTETVPIYKSQNINYSYWNNLFSISLLWQF